MLTDVERINRLLSLPFLTSVKSVNVSFGVVSLGHWQPQRYDLSNGLLLCRLDLGYRHRVMLSETISIIITLSDYGQVRPKLASLRSTSRHLFTSDLP